MRTGDTWRHICLLARARPGMFWVLGLIMMALADHRGWLLVARDHDQTDYDETYVRVVRVLDGDTIEVDQPDRKHRRPTTRVRLIGIDAPELGTDDDTDAVAATEHLRAIAIDHTVQLHIETRPRRDRWGRLLAHVVRTDDTNLAASILRAGHAVIDDRTPHRWLRRYDEAAAEGRAARRRRETTQSHVPQKNNAGPPEWAGAGP